MLVQMIWDNLSKNNTPMYWTLCVLNSIDPTGIPKRRFSVDILRP